MTPVVAGVIVAAGESTRMGRPKQLLPIAGTPMLQWVVNAAEASKLDTVVVVTGVAADEVRAGVEVNRALWAHNAEPTRGTMSSLRCGVKMVEPVDAIMKLVGDQPEITTDTIDSMIEAWDPHEHRAALVHYRDGPGHPMMFATEALGDVLAAEGDRLLWRLVEQDPDRVHRLEVDRPRPIDVNTPGDAREATVRLGAA